MVVISEEVQDVLRSIFLRDISNGRVDVPTYSKCLNVLLKLDKPVNAFLRKPSRYPAWARAGMLMTSVNGYDFGFFWNEEEQLIDIVEVFRRIDECLLSALSLMERIEHL